jgi:hypothetical protein
MAFSLLWLIFIALLGIFTLRGYARGSLREFTWSFALVVSAFIAPFVVDLIIGLINLIAGFIWDRLNSQGSPVNRWQVRPDNNFKIVLQTAFFLLAVGLSYLYGRKRPVPVPGKPNKFRAPSERSPLGALVGFFNGLFFLNYIYNNLTRITGRELNLAFLDNVTISVPQIGGNGAPQIGGGFIRFQENTQRFPLFNWLDYLPTIMGGFLLFYIIFVVLFNPPQTSEGRIDFLRLGLSLVGAVTILLIGVSVFWRR